MCLITRQLEPVILTEDLTVYKKINNKLSSSSQNFQYEYGKLYETKFTKEEGKIHGYTVFDDKVFYHYFYWSDVVNPEKDKYKAGYTGPDLISIAAGYHSFTTLKRANDCWRASDQIIVECTIPAGSEIYYDETGLAVSNKIIINKQIEDVKL